MPNYEVTIKFPDEDGAQTPRGAAEGVYMILLRNMLYGSLRMEVKDKKTGTVENIELESDLENDQSLLRFMALMMMVEPFMTEEQRQALMDWASVNVDGHSVGQFDWPGWEPIIGKKPKGFRKSEVV